MKKALILLAHPGSKSLNHSLAQSYARGLEAKGVEAELVSLLDLQFQPYFAPEQPMEPDLLLLQEKLKQAAHLALVFPTYWGLPPASIKAFLDRALLPGFAYEHNGGPLPRPLLRGRSARVVTTMDSPWWWYRFAHGRGMHAALRGAVFNYVGLRPSYATTVYAVRDLRAEQLSAWVERLYRVGEKDAKRLLKRS